MTAPTISVVVPVFNGSRYLAETLESLRVQSTPVHEVIVIDDGSSDGSATLAETHSVRPIVLRCTNRGVAFARNVGIAAASGDFVALLDQDDLWAPRRHQRLQRYLDVHPECNALVTTCTGFYLAQDRGRLTDLGDRLHEGCVEIPEDSLPGDLLLGIECGDDPRLIRMITTRELLAGPPSVTVSYVIRRALLQSAGGCVPFARSFDDYIALLNLSMVTEIAFVDEPSLLYRVHPSSTTMSTNWQLPLLTTIAAVRHGGNVVPSGSARSRSLVPDLLDDRRFQYHQVLGLANTSLEGFLDALAVIRLLGTSRTERRKMSVLALRRWLAGERDRRSPKIRFRRAASRELTRRAVKIRARSVARRVSAARR